MPCFNMGVGYLNSSLHTCLTTTLFAEPSSQLSIFCFLTLLKLRYSASCCCFCPALFLSCVSQWPTALRRKASRQPAHAPHFLLARVMGPPALTSLPAPRRSPQLFLGCVCQLGMILHGVLHLCGHVSPPGMDGELQLMLWLQARVWLLAFLKHLARV